MAEYLAINKSCEWCGREKTRKHVHHLLPVSKFPDKAADKNNLMTLCAKRCHLSIGHAGNWKTYVEPARSLCEQIGIKT